ncbi:telomerase reverse transcriptase [Plasmodium berghei]|uniref:Telomerase reverse transcriptase n=2 Tax=Plasmodium berghei TaxID=5821 RepID=A0A509ARF3_PLABA|nr:telomerase reverse transcriptase [Plasmodium berghei ANKA]CXJ13499.1 telomerase reverse transcriptase [Plasmodium berghei]SCN28297.1 telomerase reverse transcriptase [Plasmodium berghei]SCO62495.1 telomerase reverse transcriptase [Plasmodium berghei]VUC58186.1 telomerase reverse transcriptase [Plasmodium berghei ANKA]|eukprot:XP_034423949.1 telomerase reverse transcriptase [Plasmodium berghei ANKA]
MFSNMSDDISIESSYLKNIFKSTDKKIKLFKLYLEKKLNINSYSLGEFSLKHDEKFRRIFFSNILKEHIITKRKKDRLYIVNEVVINKDFFQNYFYFQYFLQNVLLFEDLRLKKIENNLNKDVFFKEKKSSLINWKQCFSHIKKKLNEKGVDKKSKIYKNSVLLFNSTKFSYEDQNCCDYFYSLKVWDIFFNYVSFDFLNYLLSNTLIFISDFFFINSNELLPIQTSFFITLSHIELKWKGNKELEKKIILKKKKLFYNTKQIKIIYKSNSTQNVNIQKKNTNQTHLTKEPETTETTNLVSQKNNSDIHAPNERDNNMTILNNSKNKRVNEKRDNEIDNMRKSKKIKTFHNSIEIKESKSLMCSEKYIDKLKHLKKIYKYLLKKKSNKTYFKIHDSHSYIRYLYLIQCSGGILKNDCLEEMKEIIKKKKEILRNEKKNKNIQNHIIKVIKKDQIIEIENNGLHKIDTNQKIEIKKKKLPNIYFFHNNDKNENRHFNNVTDSLNMCDYEMGTEKETKMLNDKKKWNKIIINRNNILQHNTTNKYKNFLFNKNMIFDKLENLPLFIYHLLNYICTSNQKYFFHNNFIDEYKQKILKQIKCNTKKNDISHFVYKKENTKTCNVVKEGNNNKEKNIYFRIKKTKILKYIYYHFSEFLNNVRNTKFEKIYNKHFPKKIMKNKIAKIFKTIKSIIIKKFHIINVRKNRKFIKQKIYDYFFKNCDFLSFSFKTYKVIDFIVHVTKKCVPVKLLGSRYNFKIFLNNVKKFILLNYKESFSMDQIMKHVKVKNIFKKQKNNIEKRKNADKNKKNIPDKSNIITPLSNILMEPFQKDISKCSSYNLYEHKKTNDDKQNRFMNYSSKNISLFQELKRKYFDKKKKIILAIQKRHFLSRLIYFIFNYFIMPLMRNFFFLTKSEHTIYRTIIFDRKLWNYFTKISNFCLYHQNFRNKKIKKIKETKPKQVHQLLKKQGIEQHLNRFKLLKKKKNISFKGNNSIHFVKSIGNKETGKDKHTKDTLFKDKIIKKGSTIMCKEVGKVKKEKKERMPECKKINNLYKIKVLNKKNVRPYLKKFYYKIRKKYFSLKKYYIKTNKNMIPTMLRKYKEYINYTNDKKFLLIYMGKRFFKKKKVNYIKLFYKLVIKIEKKINKMQCKNSVKRKRKISEIEHMEIKSKKRSVSCIVSNPDQVHNQKKRGGRELNTKIIGKRKRSDNNNNNNNGNNNNNNNGEKNVPQNAVFSDNKINMKKIYMHKIKNMIEKRNFLLKLNCINNFFSKKLRINWIPKKKGLRPLINLSTLNIPESVKARVTEILKNKKSSEFYYHNILENLERKREKNNPLRKKKYNRKNYNPVSLNNICKFSLKCLGNARSNNSCLFKNTLTKTNEIELKLKNWLEDIKNCFYRKKIYRKYIKNKLRNNKIIYAYICVGDFSNCYEHINHNYLFKFLKLFFDEVSNFEFVYLFKRSFRLYNKTINNSLLSYYPVNVKHFGMHYIRNLREVIIKSNKNTIHNFLLKQLFKNASNTDLYIFSDSYKSVQVEKRDIFMTIITIIRYYYLNIYFSIKELKLNKNNIFYFQIFQKNSKIKNNVYFKLKNQKIFQTIQQFRQSKLSPLESIEKNTPNNKLEKNDKNNKIEKSAHRKLNNSINDSIIKPISELNKESKANDINSSFPFRSNSTCISASAENGSQCFGSILNNNINNNMKNNMIKISDNINNTPDIVEHNIKKENNLVILQNDRERALPISQSNESFNLGDKIETNKIYPEKKILTFLDKNIISNICGLPQGFSLSNILCSLYYAYLDKNKEFQNILCAERKESDKKNNSINKNIYCNPLNTNSLLIRFIDDFLFSTLNKKNIKTFKNLLLKRKIWGENINSSKTKIFKIPLIYKSDLFIYNIWDKQNKEKKKKKKKLKRLSRNIFLRNTNKLSSRKLKNSLLAAYNSNTNILKDHKNEEMCNYTNLQKLEINRGQPQQVCSKPIKRNSHPKTVGNENIKTIASTQKNKGKKRKLKLRKNKYSKLTICQIKKVIKTLCIKKVKLKEKSPEKGHKIQKHIKRLKKLKKLKIKKMEREVGETNYINAARSIRSIEWLNNSYIFDFVNNSIHSISYPWKNKNDATIRNHIHLNNIIGEKCSKISFMKFLVENRIMRNVISKQKKYISLYKNKQNVYFCYKNNFILLKTSILKFICSIKTLKHMFNTFYNPIYNTKFILHLISYMKKCLIKNKNLKFVKLFLIETAIESLQYAKVFHPNHFMFRCLKVLKKIKKRLINKYKKIKKKKLLIQYRNMFNVIKRELFNSWPCMFKLREAVEGRKKNKSKRRKIENKKN